MDQSASITIGTITVLLAGFAWWYFQRMIKKNDEAAIKELADLKTLCAQNHAADVERLNQHGEKIQNLQIELERRMTRDEFREFRLEVKQDLQASSLQIITALKAGGAHGAQ